MVHAVQATDPTDLLQRAANWMLARGWKRKLAKRGAYEQSLFEHCLSELDVLTRVAPVLAQPEHLNLTSDDIRVLQVSVLAHDVGKETDGWQDYIAGRRSGPVPHIDPIRTKEVVPDVCRALGFNNVSENATLVIENCINVHHPGPASVIAGILQGQDRWWLLAQIVQAVDHLCSAAGLLEARDALGREILAQHFAVSCHLASVRGVSTTLLHRAAEDAFIAAGWLPILCFADGTLYVADGAYSPAVPEATDIASRLERAIGVSLTARDMAQLMVGSPTGNILPKPELFDFRQSRRYLEVAAQRVNRNRFIKKKIDDRRKVVGTYLRERGEVESPPSDEAVERHSLRIDAAQPEMLVFKFFKAMMAPQIVGREGAERARGLYEAKFGAGTWAQLLLTSTLMPAKDMAKTVDYFWRLSGASVGRNASPVAEIPDAERTDLLIDILDDIASAVYSGISRDSPLQALAGQMATAFCQDLVHPAPPLDTRQEARRGLKRVRGIEGVRRT